MRFPDAALAVALAVGLPAHAGADAVRTEITARLQAAHPGITIADFAGGAAAFDAERRADLERNTPAPGAAEAVAAGRKLWTRRFRNGRSLALCFPHGGRGVAAAYPQYDQRLKRVVTLETAVNQCLKTHGEALLDPADPATMGAVLAFARSIADGRKIAVRVTGPQAEERFEQGRRLYFTRMGQQNYACASCHLQNAGRYYGNTAIPAATGQAARWPFLRDLRPVTLQMQVRECLERMGATPFPPGSDELSTLDYFLTVLSNGLVIRPNEWRPAAKP